MLGRGSEAWNDMATFIVAFAVALLMGAVVIAATGSSPWDAYRAALRAAAGSGYRFLNTLCNTTVLIMTGMACSVAFNSGIQNIGAEGQLYLGAFAAAMAGLIRGIPAFVHVPLTLAVAACAGAVWALMPGILRASRGTNEVVVTLMMNYIAVLLCSYFVNYPFRNAAATWPETAMIEASARLPYLHPLSRFNGSFFVALACVVMIVFINRRTRTGYEWRMVGLNERACTVAGIVPGKVMLQAMIVSGAIAGLAGGAEVIGVRHRFMDAFSPGYGMTGVLIALVARNNPVSVALVAFIFSLVKTGAGGMELVADVPAELSEILLTLIVFMLAAQRSLRGTLRAARTQQHAER